MAAPVESRRADRGQKLSCRKCGFVVVDPTGVAEAGQLPCDRCHDPRVVVADIQGPEPRGAVQITFPFDVGYAAPLALFDDDRMIEVEGGGEDPLAPLDDFAIHN